MTTFTCISDTHNKHQSLDIPDADMIIHAGDATGRGTTEEISLFCKWYGALPHKRKILIAGNHDWGFEKDRAKHQEIAGENGIIYLQDDWIEIDGLRIHGSPQTPEFCNWAFNCWRTEYEAEVNKNGYHGDYDYIGDHWKKIPDNLDILITHGPPYMILDYCGQHVGCEELLKKVKEVKPKFHIFGHIHEGMGEEELNGTHFINASSLDGVYNEYGHKIKVYEIEGVK